MKETEPCPECHDGSCERCRARRTTPPAPPPDNVRRLAVRPRDGSEARFIASLEEAMRLVRSGDVAALAIVIVSKDGLAGVDTPHTEDPMAWLALRGALLVADEHLRGAAQPGPVDEAAVEPDAAKTPGPSPRLERRPCERCGAAVLHENGAAIAHKRTDGTGMWCGGG